MKATIEPWGMWHSKALAAGVSSELATLGRSVVRDYWQHGRHTEEERGDGPYLGADRHHDMMITLSLQKPELATAVFNAALAIGAPNEGEMQEALDNVERQYAESNVGAYATAEWYRHVYALKDCVWDLY